MSRFDKDCSNTMNKINEIKERESGKKMKQAISYMIRCSFGEVGSDYPKTTDLPEGDKIYVDLNHIIRFLVYKDHIDFISLDIIIAYKRRDVTKLLDLISAFPTKDLAYFKTRLGSEEGKNWLQIIGF